MLYFATSPLCSQPGLFCLSFSCLLAAALQPQTPAVLSQTDRQLKRTLCPAARWLRLRPVDFPAVDLHVSLAITSYHCVYSQHAGKGNRSRSRSVYFIAAPFSHVKCYCFLICSNQSQILIDFCCHCEVALIKEANLISCWVLVGHALNLNGTWSHLGITSRSWLRLLFMLLEKLKMICHHISWSVVTWLHELVHVKPEANYIDNDFICGGRSVGTPRSSIVGQQYLVLGWWYKPYINTFMIHSTPINHFQLVERNKMIASCGEPQGTVRFVCPTLS